MHNNEKECMKKQNQSPYETTRSYKNLSRSINIRKRIMEFIKPVTDQEKLAMLTSPI